MEGPKKYKVAPEVVAGAPKIGIYGTSAEARILLMAKHAQEYNHAEATHRYQQYIMTIREDGTVTMLDRMDPVT